MREIPESYNIKKGYILHGDYEVEDDECYLYYEGETISFTAPLTVTSGTNVYRFYNWEVNGKPASFHLNYEHTVTEDAEIIRRYIQMPELQEGQVFINGGAILLDVNGKVLDGGVGSGTIEAGTTITRDAAEDLEYFREWYPELDIVFLYWEKNYDIVSYDMINVISTPIKERRNTPVGSNYGCC